MKQVGVPIRFIFLVILGLLLAGAIQPVHAEQPLAEQVDEWRSLLSAAKSELDNDFPTRRPSRVMAELRELEASARSIRRSAQAELENQQSMLEELRPEEEVDEEDEEDAVREDRPPREAEALQELREELEASIAELSARRRVAALTETRAAELIDGIISWEQRRFRQRLAIQLPLPITRSVWQQAIEDGRTFVSELREAPRAWWQERRTKGEAQFAITLFIAVPLFGFLLSYPLLRMVLRPFGRDPSDTSPSYARRIGAAVADGTANAVVPVAMIGLVILALYLQGLLTGFFAYMIYVLALTVAGYLALLGLSRAALSPHMVAWRIVPVDPARVSVLLRAIRIAALVMAAGTALLWLMLLTGLNTPELESVFLFVWTILVAITGGWVLSPRYWTRSVEKSQEAGPVEQATEALQAAREDEGVDEYDDEWVDDAAEEYEDEQRSPRNKLDLIRGLLRAAVFAAPLVALIGYSRLAYFFQSRLISTAVLIGFGLLLHLAVRELIQRFFLSQPGRSGRQQKTSEASVQGMIFWTGLVADLLIIVLLVYGLLLLYGIPPTTLFLWTRNLFAGIEIGGFTLAPGNILVAVLVLSGGLILTNLFRRWLTKHVLPNTRLEHGARNSVAAGSSYVGVGIALVLAMVALGLDFTNLALVVGALSLGIGFGLRNVVENFVAGVLLLIERPIKVGDWIIVGEHEGTVRHISVRSTEIETFDRASVIVPNADLISSSVTNWTHKNRMIRIRIKVGVAYGSDTEQVAKVLLNCTREQPKILQEPPPIALFVGFGSSSLDFELRCFVGDTDDFMPVSSELHFCIERALREAGIVIPFPQRDIHIHGGGPLPGTATD